MSSDRSDDTNNLPPWLRDVPLPPQPRGAAARAPQPGSTGAAAAAAGLPEWLRELGDEPPAQSVAATPPAPQANSLPEWLRELGDEPPAPSSAAGPLPDWLRDTAPSQPAAGASPLPDWLSDIAEPAATDTPPPTEPAMPGWLHDAQSNTPPDAAPLPDWLDQSTPGAPADSADADVPNWLRSLSDDAAPDTASTAPDWLPSVPADAELPEAEAPPSWLNGLGDEPRPAPEPPHDDLLPSWLNEQPTESDSANTLTPFSFDDLANPQQSAPNSPPSWLSHDIDTAAEEPPAWLGAPASPPTEPAGASDIPLWLQDRAEDTTSAPPALDAANTGQPPPQEISPSDAPLPSWLQPSPSAAPADELPEWLRNADAPTLPAMPPVPPPAAPMPGLPTPAADELPEWLRDTSSTAGAPAQPAAETPAWLHDEPVQPQAEPSLPGNELAPPAPDDADIPAWLRDMPAEAAPELIVPPSPSVAPGADEQLPTWLKPTDTPPNVADELPPWLRDEAGAPLPGAGAPGDSNLPNWLRGAATDSPTPRPDSQPLPAGDIEGNGHSAETSAPLPANTAAGLVGGVELPAWLRPTETEPAKDEITPTDARSLDWLTRLGAQEDEEAEAASAVPAIRLAPRALPTRSPAQIEAIALLEQLAAEPFPTPAPAPELARASIWQRVGVERLLYLALFLAMVAALLLPPPNLLGMAAPPSAPGADALFKQLDRLGANDIVLVGYEWDARRSGELRPLEQAVIDHLIQNRVKLVLISTDSQGSLLLYDLRDRLEAAGYQPQGEDYILLGYKPGAELALRALARDFPSALRSDFQGNDASSSLLATTPDRQQRLKTLSDFSMVLVLGDDASDVQGWMEQARTSARRADGSYVPFGFVLPAEAEPIVQPYFSQPNVLHVAGKQGALAYQQLRGAAGMPAAQIAAEVGQQRFSQLLYLALLLIGALAVGIHSAIGRRRNQP